MAGHSSFLQSKERSRRSDLQPRPPSVISELHNFLFSFSFESLVFLCLGTLLLGLMFSSLFSHFFFFCHLTHFHVALTSVEASRREKGKEEVTDGATPSLPPSLSLSLPPRRHDTSLGVLTCRDSSTLLVFLLLLTLSSSSFWMFARGLPFPSVFRSCNRGKAKMIYCTSKLKM